MKNSITFNCVNAAILISMMMTIGCSTCNKGKDKRSDITAIDLKNMDTTVDPGKDFFSYANGGWVKNNPVPAEFSRYGSFEALDDKNNTDLKTIMESAEKKARSGKDAENKMIGDFYSSGMDSVSIEKEGYKPLSKEIQLINAIKTSDDIQTEIAHLHTLGINAVFDISAGQDEKNSEMIIAKLYQGGIGLPDRDYYLSKDKRSEEIREAYVKHIAKLFELTGSSAPEAKTSAEDVMNLENKLAEISWTRLELRDPIKGYNKFSLEELQKKCTSIRWKTYFKNIGVADPGSINVGQPSFFRGLDKIIKSTAINTWKNYFMFSLVNNTAEYLSKDFEKENFSFYATALSGKTKMKARWKRVLNTVNGSIGFAVGKLYVDKYFPEASKTKMLELVNNLKKSLKERIQKLEWMSDVTKTKAIEKLEAINVKVGYPDKWRDYSGLAITPGSFVTNVLNAEKFNFNFTMKKVNKKVDKTEWNMTPQTVNAYYNPNLNEIVFPAAILQPPFFNIDADDAVNYGAIGTVIGHEMTHGFDDEGKMYDKLGNLNNWWTNADSTSFVKHTAVLVDQYNHYMFFDTLHIDGELTLGENIADLGGITVALNALKTVLAASKDTAKIDGFTPIQRFFLAYAQVWRMTITDKELMRRLKEDVHSPGMARVNYVVRNVPEFYDAFKIKPTDKLFLPAEKRAKIW